MALALLHTYSLEGLAEGWTADCQLTYKSVTYAELKELKTLQGKEDDAAVDAIVTFVQNHFVRGRGLLTQEDGTEQIGDLTKEDITELPIETLTALFQKMTGQDADPKVETPTTDS